VGVCIFVVQRQAAPSRTLTQLELQAPSPSCTSDAAPEFARRKHRQCASAACTVGLCRDKPLLTKLNAVRPSRPRAVASSPVLGSDRLIADMLMLFHFGASVRDAPKPMSSPVAFMHEGMYPHLQLLPRKKLGSFSQICMHCHDCSGVALVKWSLRRHSNSGETTARRELGLTTPCGITRHRKEGNPVLWLQLAIILLHECTRNNFVPATEYFFNPT
jgi:hypothetical protein